MQKLSDYYIHTYTIPLAFVIMCTHIHTDKLFNYLLFIPVRNKYNIRDTLINIITIYFYCLCFIKHYVLLYIFMFYLLKLIYVIKFQVAVAVSQRFNSQFNSLISIRWFNFVENMNLYCVTKRERKRIQELNTQRLKMYCKVTMYN